MIGASVASARVGRAGWPCEFLSMFGRTAFASFKEMFSRTVWLVRTLGGLHVVVYGGHVISPLEFPDTKAISGATVLGTKTTPVRALDYGLLLTRRFVREESATIAKTCFVPCIHEGKPTVSLLRMICKRPHTQSLLTNTNT